MLVTVAFAISVALAAFVVYPLLASDGAGKGTLPVDVTPLADLKRRRLVLYENLRDLEFEYQSKKIARQDYEALRENYTAEAARLIASGREIQRSSTEDAFIEREVAARRAHRKTETPPSYACPRCGFQNPVPVKFCGECGAKMTP